MRSDVERMGYGMLERRAGDREAQRLAALRRANAVRQDKAELKRQLASDEVSVVDVLLNRPPAVERCSVGELLISQRHWGPSKCRELLASVNLSEDKPLGALTARQRELMAAEIERRSA